MDWKLKIKKHKNTKFNNLIFVKLSFLDLKLHSSIQLDTLNKMDLWHKIHKLSTLELLVFTFTIAKSI